MVTVPKMASDNPISQQCSSVCKQQIPWETCPTGLTCQLCQEVLLHMLQEPPGVPPVCWVRCQKTPEEVPGHRVAGTLMDTNLLKLFSS